MSIISVSALRQPVSIASGAEWRRWICLGDRKGCAEFGEESGEESDDDEVELDREGGFDLGADSQDSEELRELSAERESSCWVSEGSWGERSSESDSKSSSSSLNPRLDCDRSGINVSAETLG